jgi:hypothetical protein
MESIMKQKKLGLAILLAFASISAHATDSSIPLASSAKTEAAVPAVNPFTGLPTKTEEVKAETELTKAQAALLEEQSKRAKNAFLLANVDKVSSAELKKTLSTLSAGNGGNSIGGYPPDAGMPSRPSTSALDKTAFKGKSKHKKMKPEPLVSAPIAAPVFMPARPAVMGVVERDKQLYAMVQKDGDIVYAKEGGSVNGGIITKITPDAVYLNGAKLENQSTPIVNIDKQPIKSMTASAGGTGGMPPQTMSGVMPAQFPSSPPQSGGMQLPPPPLGMH